MSLEEDLRAKARELGVPLIGFSRIERTSYGQIVRERIARGLIPKELVDLTECFRVPETYADPARSLPGARSLICIGGPYLEIREPPSDTARRGAIARHYWRDTYTDLQKKRESLIDHLRALGFRAEKADVHPREAAKLAGLAWIGRNALAINPVYGSWALYYALVTDAELDQTTRIDKACPKNCRRCMDACPTKALIEPYVLDVNKCLNYLLEDKEPVPDWARVAVGNRVNGCDACQEACPMNKGAKPAPTPLTARTPDRDLVPWPLLEGCFEVTQPQMQENYGYMDWYAPEVRYLRRNALIAAGNSGLQELLPAVERFVECEDSVLREHARWARDRLTTERR